MTWKPVVAGVDASREGALAAAMAWAVAEAAQVGCRLVHVTRALPSMPAAPVINTLSTGCLLPALQPSRRSQSYGISLSWGSIRYSSGFS